jgi:hypothetical protein
MLMMDDEFLSDEVKIDKLNPEDLIKKFLKGEITLKEI